MKKFLKALVFVAMFVVMANSFNLSEAKAANDVSPAEEKIVGDMHSLKDKITLDSYNINKYELFDIMYNVSFYYPELYYFSGGYSYKTNASGSVAYVKPKYSYSTTEVTQMNATFEEKANKIAAKADSSMSQLEKVLTVYNCLAVGTAYDEDEEEISGTAYGPIVNGKGTCYGYASAFNYIMKNKLGFDCEIIISDCGTHSWNIIKVDGKYYHCDVTWADPTSDVLGTVWHKYFMVSDSAMKKIRPDYTWQSDLKATSTKYDSYSWKNVTVSLAKYNGTWYCIDSSAYLCKMDLNTGKTTRICNLSTKIGNIVKDYYGIYNKLAVVGNNMYVSNANKIYKVTVSGNSASFSSISGISVSYGKKIYGIGNIDGVLKYHEKTSSFWDIGTIKATSIKE